MKNNPADDASILNDVVRSRTKAELMEAHWRSKTCAPYDSRETVRTGREWFNRYMLYPWERENDFDLVD